MASKLLIERLNANLQRIGALKGFDRFMKQVKVVSATPGKLELEMTVDEEHTNPVQTMHGGLTASLIDVSTTYALMTTEDARPGVSLSLDVNYLKAVQIGEKIRIEAEVLKQGRSIAFTKAKLLNQKGELIAVGSHVKHLGS